MRRKLLDALTGRGFDSDSIRMKGLIGGVLAVAILAAVYWATIAFIVTFGAR